MSTTREGSNPLRPYYIPPSIGIPQDAPRAANVGTHGLGPRNGSAASYASSAREMFSDMDYSEYLSESSPSTVEMVQEWVNERLYLYMSVIFSQPFDVAKTVLQVRRQDDGGDSLSMEENLRPSHRPGFYAEDHSDDSDQDENTYFTSAAPTLGSVSPSRSRSRRARVERSPSPSPTTINTPPHQLPLKQFDSLVEVITQEWTKEGASGVWKGSNPTFGYAFLAKLIEPFSRGLLSALFNVPDPGLTTALGPAADVLDTNYPWVSLSVALTAAVMTGVLLSPIDLVRTKLMLTPTKEPKRGLMYNLNILPSYFCPTVLLLPTILHSLVTPAFSHSTPLFLRSRLGIDPVMTPSSYSIAKFVSRSMELFVKLPLETVLRRGQMAVLATPEYQAPDGRRLQTTVDIGPYNGVFGTMWSIAREEGIRQETPVIIRGKIVKTKSKKPDVKGQGVMGLWRGWKVGFYGLIGLWGANAMGASGNGAGEF